MKENNKVEVKSFLGMEVRVVNDEYIDADCGIYIIEFNCNKYKIGSTNNFNNRVLSYKPYSFMISNITLLKCFNPYEMEKILLRNIQDNKFYGEEWFEGIPNYNDIYTVFDKYNKNEFVSKNNIIYNNYDKHDFLNLFCPSKKTKDFEYTLEVIYKTTIYLSDNINNNIKKFRNFYYNCNNNLKKRIVNTIINTKIELNVLIKLIDIYLCGDFKLGKFIILEKLLEELKIFQPQTTVDLLEVREFVLEKFVNAYEFTGSHKTAREMTIKLALKKYNLEKVKSIAV